MKKKRIEISNQIYIWQQQKHIYQWFSSLHNISQCHDLFYTTFPIYSFWLLFIFVLMLFSPLPQYTFSDALDFPFCTTKKGVTITITPPKCPAPLALWQTGFYHLSGSPFLWDTFRYAHAANKMRPDKTNKYNCYFGNHWRNFLAPLLFCSLIRQNRVSLSSFSFCDSESEKKRQALERDRGGRRKQRSHCGFSNWPLLSIVCTRGITIRIRLKMRCEIRPFFPFLCAFSLSLYIICVSTLL